MPKKSMSVDASSSMKESLIQRYRTTFIRRLTRKDLKELQEYLKNEFDAEGRINPEYRKKFEEKLMHYFHQDVLEREIVSLEALVRGLLPEDLER